MTGRRAARGGRRADLLDATIYRVSWAYDPGSVRTATVNMYRLCWETDRGRRICHFMNGDALRLDFVSQVEIVALKSIEISPDRKRFLGLGDGFYPPQSFDLRY